MTIPAETVFFQDVNATVTNQRVIIAGRFYPTANITSVHVIQLPQSQVGGWVMIAVGVLTMLCSSLAFIPNSLIFPFLYQSNPLSQAAGGVFSYLTSIGVVGIMVGLGLIGGGILFMTLRKPKYLLRIGSSFMESDALISTDRAYLEYIAGAINNALPQR